MGCPERPLLQDIINRRSRAKVIAPIPASSRERVFPTGPVTPWLSSNILQSRG